MKNPFILISDSGFEYTDGRCSINRVPIAKLPLYGVDDEIEGKTVSQIFSTGIIAEDIRKNADALGISVGSISNRGLVYELIKKISQDNEAAIETVRKYGRRLGLIFLTLKTGENENRLARTDWNDDCWNYWRNVKHVLLVGGLTSGVFGAILKAEALSVFEKAGVEPYDFQLFDNAAYVGLMGCASQIKGKDGTFIVFDFGQTSLKRGVVQKQCGEIIKTTMLESFPSEFMSHIKPGEPNVYEQAVKLNFYLTKCICDTVKNVERKQSVGSEIIISIANYICGGNLYADRGGYAKLACLCKNYGEYLENELSGQLRRSLSVRLIHDATAAALYFADCSDSVCITLGTAFGVGFPEIKP